MAEARVSPASGHQVVETDWGRLVWMISGALGNSETLTVGRCHIRAGQANPRHLHPNCDEVVHVLEGEIEHSFGDESVRLRPGDALAIPAGVVHNARNAGDGDAVLTIVFSSATRLAVAEDGGPPP